MASETFTFYVQPWYRKSPYFEATKRHGCKSWGLYNHMLLPTLTTTRSPSTRRCSTTSRCGTSRSSGASRSRVRTRSTS